MVKRIGILPFSSLGTLLNKIFLNKVAYCFLKHRCFSEFFVLIKIFKRIFKNEKFNYNSYYEK